jgi:hypothetical protein
MGAREMISWQIDRTHCGGPVAETQPRMLATISLRRRALSNASSTRSHTDCEKISEWTLSLAGITKQCISARWGSVLPL